MGTRHQDRVPRLRSFRVLGAGWISVVQCRGCGHMGALPYDRLVRRFGELMPIDDVEIWLRCQACGAKKPEVKRVRLCEPGCPRQRG